MWGLQQTTRALDSDKTRGQGSIKKNGPYIWPVFAKTGWTWHVTLPPVYSDFTHLPNGLAHVKYLNITILVIATYKNLKKNGPYIWPDFAKTGWTWHVTIY